MLSGKGAIVVAGIHVNPAPLSLGQRLKLIGLRALLSPLAIFGILCSFEFSRVGAQYALDIVTGRNAGPGARTTYLALLTAAPTDASTTATMTELSTAGYARQSAAFSAPSAADPPETHNTGVITWGPFTADPPNVTHFALVSSSSGTGGDFLAWGALTAARDAGNGDSLQAAASAFSITAT